ncbi:MAG TPA: DNA methyltransferase [Gaiellaceae bacterium]|nr:DNA methyltransferase [Gaiellaceae bacterium]
MTVKRALAPVGGPSALSVWPVAQKTAREQRRGRYLPAATAHPGKMLPELARTIIHAYSKAGELVLDPMCGIGTSLVEAIHLDRDAAGVELEPRWASLASANIALAREQGATASALCLQGDARRLGRGVLDELAGQAALILTSPPYGPSLHGQVKAGHGRPVEKWDDRYSRNPGNLAHLPASSGRRPSFADALAEILAGCRRMLAPQGRLVLTARPYRSQGVLVDLPGQIVRLAGNAGLTLCERRVALLCGLRDGRLVPRTSFFQLTHQRRSTFERMLLIAHEDVLVLTHDHRLAAAAATTGAR